MLGWVQKIKGLFDRAADHYTGAGKLREENESLKAENKRLSDQVEDLQGHAHRGPLALILLAVLLGLSLAANLFFLFLKH